MVFQTIEGFSCQDIMCVYASLVVIGGLSAISWQAFHLAPAGEFVPSDEASVRLSYTTVVDADNLFIVSAS